MSHEVQSASTCRFRIWLNRADPVGHVWLLCLPVTRKEQKVPAHTYKIIDLVGSSETGTDDAIRNAIAKASHTVKNMDWFEVVETRGHIQNAKIAHYQVTIRVGFRIED
jgi:flavin-binding protein dodecin